MMIARSRTLTFQKLKSSTDEKNYVLTEGDEEFQEIQEQNNDDKYNGRRGLRERVGQFFKGVR